MKDSNSFGHYVFRCNNYIYLINHFELKSKLRFLKTHTRTVLLYLVSEVMFERKKEIFIKDIISDLNIQASTLNKAFNELEKEWIINTQSEVTNTWFLSCGYIPEKIVDLNYYGDWSKVLDERWALLAPNQKEIVGTINREAIENYLEYVKLPEFEYEYISHTVKHIDASFNENGYYDDILVKVIEKLSENTEQEITIQIRMATMITYIDAMTTHKGDMKKADKRFVKVDVYNDGGIFCST